MALRIEQAVFTSARGGTLEGYHLVATSEGISSELAQELATWGPAHDSLLVSSGKEPSINFHPLRNGDFCLSRTTLAGSEYSGRGGGRTYTQMLIIPREGLLRFYGNPWSILRAMAAAGRLMVYHNVPKELPSFPLIGRGIEMDEPLIAEVFSHLDAEALAELAESLLAGTNVAVLSSIPAEQLFAGVLQLLPVEDRLQISFTTGLKHSARRPYRLFVAPDDLVGQRSLQRLSGVKVVDLREAAALAT